jgi:hypothetical protein
MPKPLSQKGSDAGEPLFGAYLILHQTKILRFQPVS